VLLGAIMLSGRVVHAQPTDFSPPGAAMPDPFQTPLTVDPVEAPVVRPPQGLRGPVEPARFAPPPPRIQRRTATFVREPPPNPRSRTQRPVQGVVQRPTQIETTEAVRRRVYDPRASTLGEVAAEIAPAPVRRRQQEVDPFSPLGIRVGSFILRPSIESGIGWTDNANVSATNRQRSAFSRVAAEGRLDSDWRIHALGLRLRAERQDFARGGLEPNLTLDAAVTARVDVTRDTQMDAGASFRRAPDSATTFDLPVTAVGRPDLDTTSVNAAVTQRFGRIALRLRGQYDQLRYGDTDLADGTRLSNASRNVDVSTVSLRAGYEVAPGLSPFVEVSGNRRDFRQDVDAFGTIQGSSGTAARGGVAVDFGPKLRGEFALGYLIQRPRDPSLQEFSGFTIDGSLEWSISPLTTLRAVARTGILDTSTPGAFGGIARDAIFTLEHALTRNVLVSGTVGLGIDDFAGITRTDRRFSAALAATWRFNRQMSLRLEATRQQLRSTAPANDTVTNTVQSTLRIEF
jgi:hypothetical protein